MEKTQILFLIFCQAIACNNSDNDEIDAGSGEEIDIEEIDTDSGEEIDIEEIDAGSGEEIDEEPIHVPACRDSYFHSASVEFSNVTSWGCPEGYRCNAWAYLYRCSPGPDQYEPLFIDDEGVIHGLCSSGVCDEDGNQNCELYAGAYGNTCLPEKIWEKIYH
jgi:hypothetical protein